MLSEQKLGEAFADIWRHSLDWVAQRYEFSVEMTQAAWNVFRNMEVRGPMQGYADLATLEELQTQRYLVTSGFRRLQESKINALGLRPRLDAAFVDAIDEPDRIGKLGLFRHILAHNDLATSDVLVVGDNADSEIAAGNQLGIATVQTLRPGVPRAASATHYIHSLIELRRLVQ